MVAFLVAILCSSDHVVVLSGHPVFGDNAVVVGLESIFWSVSSLIFRSCQLHTVTSGNLRNPNPKIHYVVAFKVATLVFK